MSEPLTAGCVDDKTSEKIQAVVTVVSIIVTIVAYKWIKRQLKEATPDFIYARRKARQGNIVAPVPLRINGPYMV